MVVVDVADHANFFKECFLMQAKHDHSVDNSTVRLERDAHVGWRAARCDARSATPTAYKKALVYIRIVVATCR